MYLKQWIANYNLWVRFRGSQSLHMPLGKLPEAVKLSCKLEQYPCSAARIPRVRGNTPIAHCQISSHNLGVPKMVGPKDNSTGGLLLFCPLLWGTIHLHACPFNLAEL